MIKETNEPRYRFYVHSYAGTNHNCENLYTSSGECNRIGQALHLRSPHLSTCHRAGNRTSKHFIFKFYRNESSQSRCPISPKRFINRDLITCGLRERLQVKAILVKLLNMEILAIVRRKRYKMI